MCRIYISDNTPAEMSGRMHGKSQLTCAVGKTAGGGDTGEELDISLLHVRLFHEAWQGMLHNLDDVTLRANSAVPSAANANNSAVAEHATASSSQDAAEAMPNTVSSSNQQHSAENVESNSGTGSRGLEKAREAKSEAMSNSMEAQVQQDARTQSEQQASSSAADSSRQYSAAAAAGADLSQGPCINSKQLEGSWKVFDLAAVPIDETDVDTGDLSGALSVGSISRCSLNNVSR